MSVATEAEVNVVRESKLGKLASGIGEAYKFAWYTCLGTAITVEEKVSAFSKQMADRGVKVEMKTPMGVLERRKKLTSARDEIKHKAQERIEDVEQMIDEGVNRSLHFMGVPSRKDMDEMTSLMKDMADSITELSSQLQNQKPAASRARKAAKAESSSVA